MGRVKTEPIFIPTVRVHPDMLTVYSTVEWTRGRPARKPSMNIPSFGQYYDQKKAYSGLLPPHAKKRLRRAINLLVAQADLKDAQKFETNQHFKFKVNFVTLTLPAPQGEVLDKSLKKRCLDPFLKTMRRKHGLKSYVWRAER